MAVRLSSEPLEQWWEVLLTPLFVWTQICAKNGSEIWFKIWFSTVENQQTLKKVKKKEEMPDMVVVTEPVVLLDETGSKSTVDRNCSCPQHTQTPAGHPPAASDSN